MTDTDAQPTATDSKTLMLPLSRREVILALMAAVASKRKAELKTSGWTQISLADGALD